MSPSWRQDINALMSLEPPLKMHTAARTHSFTESVIRGMTRLANQHDAINLAQGFPDFPSPTLRKDAAGEAI